MVLAVQEETPTVIPYLDGETYAFLPFMLVPRFLNADKPESSAVTKFVECPLWPAEPGRRWKDDNWMGFGSRGLFEFR